MSSTTKRDRESARRIMIDIVEMFDFDTRHATNVMNDLAEALSVCVRRDRSRETVCITIPRTPTSHRRVSARG